MQFVGEVGDAVLKKERGVSGMRKEGGREGRRGEGRTGLANGRRSNFVGLSRECSLTRGLDTVR